MNKNTLLKKIKLSDKDFEEIKESVKKAEEKTNGEIALAITAESSHYSFWELGTSVLISLLLIVCLLPLTNQIYGWLSTFIWGMTPLYLVLFYFAVCAVITLILFGVFNIVEIDRIIVPESVKQNAVKNRAVRYFAESGVYCTKDHSGILVFVSYFEKSVYIVADKGISEKISQDLWNLIRDEMLDLLKQNDVKGAFTDAVSRCGDLLSEYFPAKSENPNELSDGLVVLEDEKWV